MIATSISEDILQIAMSMSATNQESFIHYTTQLPPVGSGIDAASTIETSSQFPLPQDSHGDGKQESPVGYFNFFSVSAYARFLRDNVKHMVSLSFDEMLI